MLNRPPNSMPNKTPKSTSKAPSATFIQDLRFNYTLTEFNHRQGTVMHGFISFISCRHVQNCAEAYLKL